MSWFVRRPLSTALAALRSRRPGSRHRPAVEELENRVLPALLGQSLFPADYPTNNSIAGAPVSSSSATWIAAMAASKSHLVVDWGAYTPTSSGPLYSMPYNVVHSKDTANYASVKVYIDNYPNETDLSGTDPSQGNRPYVLVPMPKVNPQNLFIEGDNQNGANPSRFTSGGSDSHLIVWDADTNKGYEFWEASRPSESSSVPGGYYLSTAIANQWNAANEATWNMSADSLRTLGYTSADAAGLPILSNIARPDEALTSAHGGQSATPVINHALRFTLNGNLVAHDKFIFPASHGTGSAGSIPYGTRFRLSNNAAVNALIAGMGPQSQVIAKALQTYGLILADIGTSMFVQGAATSVDTNNNPIIDPTTGKPITWDMTDLLNGLATIPTTDFQAVDLTPQVTGLSASSGPAGSTITVTGLNFSGSAGHLSVLFVPSGNNPPYTSTPAYPNSVTTTLKAGVVAAGTFTILDDSHIQVVVPNGVSGTVDVQVLSGQLLDDTYNSDAENATAPIFGYGISAQGAADKFTYTLSNPTTHFQVSTVGATTAGSTITVTVTALDASNATTAGYSGTVHITSTDPQAGLPADAKLTNGVGTFSVTLKTAGSRTVTATDTVVGSITGVSGSVLVSAGLPAVLGVVTGSQQSAVVGAAYGTNLQVGVLDNYGNAVGGTGTLITFTAYGNSLGAGGTFAGGGTSVTGLTNASGIAAATAFTANGRAGTFVVVATFGSLLPATFTLTNTPTGVPFSDAFAPAQSTLTAANWQVLGGGFSQNGTRAVAGSAANNYDVYRTGLPTDVSVVAQNVSVIGTGTVGLIARLTGPTGYLATLNNSGSNGVVTIFELTPTAFVKLTSVNVGLFSSPVTLRFDVIGISLRVYVNNVLDASILDTSVSGPGQAGIYGTPGETLGTFTVSPSVPALPLTDAFTPNQSALTAANWQPLQGNFSQSNGKAVAGSGANNYDVIATAAVADVSVTAQNVSVIGSGTVGLLARLVAPGGYLATLNNSGSNGVVTIFEVTPAAYINLASVNVGLFSTPVTLRFDVIGNSLKVFVNGTLDASVLNSELTGAGLVGLYGTSGETLGTYTATAAVPTLPFSDSFAPSQASLTAANWTAQNGGFSQNGTQAVASSVALNLATYRNASVADVSVSAQNVVVTTGGSAGLVARYTNATSYYLALISNSGGNGVVSIYQSTLSGYQLLTSATVAAFSSPVNLTFNVQGSSLQVLINGSVKASVTNSALTGPGLVGLWATPNELFGPFSATAL